MTVIVSLGRQIVSVLCRVGLKAPPRKWVATYQRKRQIGANNPAVTVLAGTQSGGIGDPPMMDDHILYSQKKRGAMRLPRRNILILLAYCNGELAPVGTEPSNAYRITPDWSQKKPRLPADPTPSGTAVTVEMLLVND